VKFASPWGNAQGSQRIEAQTELILSLWEATKDTTLGELRGVLAEQSLSFSYGALWRFFDRRGYTVKKRPRMQANRSGRMS
jgi:transposase